MIPERYTSYTIQVNDGVARTFRAGTVQITETYLAYRKNSLMAILISPLSSEDGRLREGAIASASFNGVEVIPRDELVSAEIAEDGVSVLVQAKNRTLLTLLCESPKEAQTVCALLQ